MRSSTTNRTLAIYRNPRDRWVEDGNLHSSSAVRSRRWSIRRRSIAQVALSCRRAGMPGWAAESTALANTPPEPIGAFRKRIDDACHRRHEVTVSNPAKVLFPRRVHQARSCRLLLAWRKAAARRGGRPNMLVRFQRIGAPRSIKTCAGVSAPGRRVSCASRRRTAMSRPRTPAALAWLQPRLPRAASPSVRAKTSITRTNARGPRSCWHQVAASAAVAQLARAVSRLWLVGWPKTSGSAGCTCSSASTPLGFDEVRRAALALAREVEGRARTRTSKWWKEERQACSWTTTKTRKTGRSRRPTRCGLCRTPVSDRCPGRSGHCDPETSHSDDATALRQIGDRHAGMDASAGSLDGLLELSARQNRKGRGCPLAAALPQATG